jgi:hypothetical protein
VYPDSWLPQLSFSADFGHLLFLTSSMFCYVGVELSNLYTLISMCCYVSSVLWCPLRFPHKQCSMRLYLQLFVGGLSSYLCCLVNCAYWCPTTRRMPWQVSYKKQELLTFREHLGSPPIFGVVRVVHLLSCLCWVLFVFILCLVWAMLPISLDCPFSISLWFSLKFI